MKNSRISWTHHTFNPWWGCTKVSEGCKGCYAETFSRRTGHNIWGPTAPRRFFPNQSHWTEPIKWNNEAMKAGQKQRVFLGSMLDWAETHRDAETQAKMDEARGRLSDLVRGTPSLEWLFLTKRVENASRYLWQMFGRSLPDNIWLGTTAENQEMYNRRVPLLATIPATVRFVSIEPQLERVTMLPDVGITACSEMVDWVIVGGESGPKCRPFDVDWARQLRDECAEMGTLFFMKQLGGHPKKRDELADFPEDLRIQEIPE